MPQLKLSPLPPEEAIRYFAAKGYQTSFAWQDMYGEEHARAFTVAKVMRMDILEDIRREVDLALRNGTTLNDFRKNLTPILQAKGWWGKQTIIDPDTGIPTLSQLGSPRRLKTIYQVNLRTSRAAGRWQRMERVKDRRPYLMYSAVLDGRTRSQHRAWHMAPTILPFDHPFWETHYPPNGWNCRCLVRQLSGRDLERMGLSVSPDPVIQTKPWRNNRTGRTVDVPVGISPGFEYNVGKHYLRGLTPPKLGRSLNRPAIDAAKHVPMPPARKIAADQILPDDVTIETAINSFFERLGISKDKGGVIKDPIGEAVVIDEAMFFNRNGAPKLVQKSRRQAVKLIADTITKPDEIWYYWEHNKVRDRYELRRRYLSHFDVDGRPFPVIVVFDVGRSGWTAVTGFQARHNNLLRQRAGTLAYRRLDRNEKPDT